MALTHAVAGPASAACIAQHQSATARVAVRRVQLRSGNPLLRSLSMRPAAPLACGKRLQVSAAATVSMPSGNNTTPSPVQKDSQGFLFSKLFKDLVDVDAEKGEELLQKAYGPEDWERHRKPGRHVRHVMSLRRSKYTRNIMRPVVASFLLTAMVGLYSTYLVPMYGLPAIVKVGYAAIGVCTSCLSLLLVFRTNNSYGRFDEARKLWGSLVNRTRDIVRQCTIYFPWDAKGRESARAVARWSAALAFCLRANIRLPREEPINTLRGWLNAQELAVLEASAHRSNCCMQVLGELIRKNIKDGDEALRMDENVRVFEDVVGACERIYRTPLPVSYTRHTSRFLSIWALLLPFGLWAEVGWTALLFVPILTFLLFAIDEIGVQLEEPFTVLPLAAICETIRANTQEIVERAEQVRALTDDLYDKASVGSSNN